MPRHTPVRYLLRIRAEIEGISPPIVRELTIDRDVDAGVLARALKAAFGLTGCARHEFTDSRDPHFPDHPDLAALSESDLYEHDRRLRKQWPPYRGPERRWGDRWTMIDARDPHTIFETSVTVAQLFRPAAYWDDLCAGSIFFRCDHEDSYSSGRAGLPWWLRLDLIGDGIDLGSGPVAQLADGVGAAPFDSEAGAHSYATLLAQWRDEQSPGHAEARARARGMAGPWAAFDPDTCDLDADRAELASALGDAEPLPAGAARLLESVPASVRPGLRRHLQLHGVGLPPVITSEQAEHAMALFRRVVIEVIGPEGRALDDAAVAVAELEGDPDAAARLLEVMRSLRLIYRRNGSWRVPRDVLTQASRPLDLWHRVAWAVSILPGATPFLLLAIADGTIADEDAVLEQQAMLCSAEGPDLESWAPPAAPTLQRTLGPATRASLDELRGILLYLLPRADRGRDLADSETLREFARTCLQ